MIGVKRHRMKWNKVHEYKYEEPWASLTSNRLNTPGRSSLGDALERRNENGSITLRPSQANLVLVSAFKKSETWTKRAIGTLEKNFGSLEKRTRDMFSAAQVGKNTISLERPAEHRTVAGRATVQIHINLHMDSHSYRADSLKYNHLFSSAKWQSERITGFQLHSRLSHRVGESESGASPSAAKTTRCKLHAYRSSCEVQKMDGRWETLMKA